MPRHNNQVRHQLFKDERPCARKRRFRSEQEALKATEDASIMDIRLELKTYKCPYCGGWHLSSNK